MNLDISLNTVKTVCLKSGRHTVVNYNHKEINNIKLHPFSANNVFMILLWMLLNVII